MKTGILFLATLTVFSTSLAGASSLSSPSSKTRMQSRSNYQNGKFVNSLPMREDDWGLVDVLTIAKRWLTNKAQVEPDPGLHPEPLSPADFAAAVDPDLPDLSVRWLGHSTLWIEIEGKRILTDPIWSQRASPVQFAGPKRFYPPLIVLDELPEPDVILISHNHYDHLDKNTIKAFAKRNVPFVVPIGIGQYLQEWGVPATRITELGWWQETHIAGIKLACTPARHFSGRGPFDRNKTLWASWAIIGQKYRVYFGGDSGLTPQFSEIGDKYGPFDMTFLDSGAYNQQWSDVHMGPEQAIVAHRALKGNVYFPIHWGLFNLSIHSWVEPIERALRAAQAAGIPVATPVPGKKITLDNFADGPRWWPDNVAWKTASAAPVTSSHLPKDWQP